MPKNLRVSFLLEFDCAFSLPQTNQTLKANEREYPPTIALKEEVCIIEINLKLSTVAVPFLHKVCHFTLVIDWSSPE